MSGTPFLAGEGCSWTLLDNSGGGATVRAWPSNFIGGNTGTNTSSIMYRSNTNVDPPPKSAVVFGFIVLATPGAGATVGLGAHAAATLAGMTLPAEAVGVIPIGANGEGVKFEVLNATSGSNFHIACSAGVSALMFWKRTL